MILNKIVHPAVRREVYKALVKNYLCGSWAVVLDVPLLFESGMDIICGTVMVVSVSDPKTQMERLRTRDPHLSAEDAANRVRSQGDVKGKVAKAEFRGAQKARGVVVVNDGDKDQLRGEVSTAMRIVSGSSPRWWSWILLSLPPLAAGVALWNMLVNFQLRKGWERKEREEKANS